MSILHATRLFTTDGVLENFEFSFDGGYLDKSTVLAHHTPTGGVLTPITITPTMWITADTLHFTPALPAGVLTIYRDSNLAAPKVTFAAGGALTKANLDTAYKQALFCAAEVHDTKVLVGMSSTEVALALAAQAAVLQGGIDTVQANLEAAIDGIIVPSADDISANDAASGTLFSTVQGFIEHAQSWYVPAYAGMRLYAGAHVGPVQVGGCSNYFDGGAGIFVYDPADGTTLDNNGTVLVDTLGRRWKRQFTGQVNIKWFGAKGNGIDDDAPPIQAAVDYLYTLFSGVLFCPDGRYLLNTPVTIKNHIHVYGTGTGTNGVSAKGTYFIANNATACFTATVVQKIKFHGVGFLAQGAGVGVAYAYKQTNLTAYTARAVFYDCDVWANMGGGFYGNFILTTWQRCQFGYLGTVGAQFLPIYSKGDISGNQTNANLIEDCYILQSKGTHTIFFEAGSDLTLRNVRFEQCAADSLLDCAGIFTVNCDAVYVEAANGAGCLYPFIFRDDTTAAQSCYTISFNNSYIYLVAPNTHIFRHLGASGNIDFNNNVVYNLAGRNLTSSVSGTNKGFGSYLGNRTVGFSLKRDNVFTFEGTWTPAIKSTSGTQAHTNGTQYGEYKRSGNYVTAMFKVSITAKDAGATGFTYIDMGTLPAVDATKAAAIEGFAGTLYTYIGVTQGAGLTQLGIAVNATGKILLTGAGSGTANAQLPFTGIGAATTLVGQITYITSAA